MTLPDASRRWRLAGRSESRTRPARHGAHFSVSRSPWDEFCHGLLGDPRLYQIATLASLLAYGLLFLNFDITVARVVVLLATVIVTQAACDRLAYQHSAVNVRSALISGLSLCLLLRTNRPELAVLAAVLTIAGKFLIRFRGKHLFNPTNGGLVAMLILTDQVWVSPGQWGAAAFFAFLMACLGSL